MAHLSALVDAYPEERRSVAVAVWSGISAAGAVAGTIVAGLIAARGESLRASDGLRL